jgi:hypothetical protein
MFIQPFLEKSAAVIATIIMNGKAITKATKLTQLGNCLPSLVAIFMPKNTGHPTVSHNARYVILVSPPAQIDA